MDKENFINKWASVYNVNDTTNPYFISDLEAVIKREIEMATQQTTAMQPENPKGNCSTFDGSRLVDQDYKPTEQSAPEMCESDAIDYILTNKLNWKKLGDNRMFAIGFARTGNSFRVSFVEYHRMLSGNREVIINKIDLSEWQPVDTSIKRTSLNTKQFDRDRFERIFCSVVANGGHELDCKEAINLTQVAISELDAFYINQEKGGTNG